MHLFKKNFFGVFKPQKMEIFSVIATDFKETNLAPYLGSGLNCYSGNS